MDVRPFKDLLHSHKTDKVAEELKKGLKNIADALKTPPRPPIPRDRRNEDSKTLQRLESLMPELFEEMRDDLRSTPLRREFILMRKGAAYVGGKKEILAYYFECHEDLAEKVGLLVNEGLVTDITYNRTDRYVFSEPLVEYLVATKQDKRDELEHPE